MRACEVWDEPKTEIRSRRDAGMQCVNQLRAIAQPRPWGARRRADPWNRVWSLVLGLCESISGLDSRVRTKEKRNQVPPPLECLGAVHLRGGCVYLRGNRRDALRVKKVRSTQNIIGGL